MTAHGTTAAYHPWGTYIAAREEARRLGGRRIGSDHLLLALLHDPSVVELLGVSLDAARDTLVRLDDAALVAIGMPPIPAVPFIVERTFPARPSMRYVLQHRMKMTPVAKRALQDTGRPTRNKGRQYTPRAVLAALVENSEPDPAATLLAALGVDLVALRARLREAGD